MATARAFPTLLKAQMAAAFLRDSGVPATVLGGLDAFGGAGTHGSAGGYSVVVEDGSLELALELLAQMDENAGGPGPEWESQARPDLSRLDPGMEAPCPACGRALPLDASVSACAACGAAVDVAEILVGRYGPEVLAGCYPDQEDIPEAILDSAVLFCRRCRYPLSGLDPRGQCPECGEPYDKQDILRRGSGLM